MAKSDKLSAPNDQAANRCAFIVVHALAFSLIAFLRSRFGRRYVGMQGVVAAVILFFWAAIDPQHSSAPMWLFLLGYLAMCVWARWSTTWRVLSGSDASHTRYSGHPRLARWLPRMREDRIKRFVEPLVGFAIGMAAMPISPSLGTYLVIASVTLCATENSAAHRDAERALDLQDAVIEATGRNPRSRPTTKYVPQQVK